uniref:Uncharacterized protein n=1 Tax=Pararge aegeria TaxID=116150 RepID=S4PK50_9NEOP
MFLKPSISYIIYTSLHTKPPISISLTQSCRSVWHPTYSGHKCNKLRKHLFKSFGSYFLRSACSKPSKLIHPLIMMGEVGMKV